jgi:hypothetical protein
MPFGTGDKQCCKGNASVEKVLDAVQSIARFIVEIEQRYLINSPNIGFRREAHPPSNDQAVTKSPNMNTIEVCIATRCSYPHRYTVDRDDQIAGPDQNVRVSLTSAVLPIAIKNCSTPCRPRQWPAQGTFEEPNRNSSTSSDTIFRTDGRSPSLVS